MSELLTIEQAQCVLPMSRAWFAKERWRGAGPEYVKIGSRVFYRRDSLLEFAARHAVKPTPRHDNGRAAEVA
jgi:hypothetical protein